MIMIIYLELGELSQQPLVQLRDPLTRGLNIPEDRVQIKEELPAVRNAPAQLNK